MSSLSVRRLPVLLIPAACRRSCVEQSVCFQICRGVLWSRIFSKGRRANCQRFARNRLGYRTYSLCHRMLQFCSGTGTVLRWGAIFWIKGIRPDFTTQGLSTKKPHVCFVATNPYTRSRIRTPSKKHPMSFLSVTPPPTPKTSSTL